MTILFDVEKFDNPTANANLLDAFLAIKKELQNSLQHIQDRIEESNTYTVVCLKPSKITIYFITSNTALASEMNDILNSDLDLTKIASEILSKSNN